MAILASRYGRQCYRLDIIESKAGLNKVNNAPERHHHKETDDSIEHEVLAFRTLRLIGTAKNKYLKYPPKESYKCNSEDERD